MDSESAPVAKKHLEPFLVARVGNNHDVIDPGFHQSRQGIENERLVVHGNQQFVGDGSEGIEARTVPAPENNAFHKRTLLRCMSNNNRLRAEMKGNRLIREKQQMSSKGKMKPTKSLQKNG